jgi:hypothetical protein
MKKSHKIVTYLVIAMGLIHITRTPVIFDVIKMRVGWYITSGLMSIFLGFLNILYWRINGDNKLIKWLCLSANITAFIYSLLLVSFFQDIENIIVAVLFGYLTFSSFYLTKIKKD